ncbi:hypothetical protein, partial [Kitasatospora sp. NPDC093558]|uniref:hypothetical protein n=1 Tax=Kitasatospora sp. NPDC093558 TaxID=3155201 RepID=UPI00344825CB
MTAEPSHPEQIARQVAGQVAGQVAAQTATPDRAVFAGRPAPAPRTLVDILDATVRSHPNEPALDDGRTVLSYRALATEVAQLRRRLAAAGLGPGVRGGMRVPSGS